MKCRIVESPITKLHTILPAGEKKLISRVITGGNPGPMGPQGPEGPAGPQGTMGTLPVASKAGETLLSVGPGTVYQASDTLHFGNY